MKPTTIHLDKMRAVKLETVGGQLKIAFLALGIEALGQHITPESADELAVALVRHATAAKAAA